jgi:amino acid transporter
MPVWHNRHRLGNPAHRGDVLSALGGSIFGSSGFGNFLTHLLLLMVLSSAAASTQTTILPTARTTLSMVVYKALPAKFANIHRKYLVPTVSTVSMGAASVVLYVIMNHISAGTVLMLIYGAVGPRSSGARSSTPAPKPSSPKTSGRRSVCSASTKRPSRR